jgi:hypothetical protein
MPFGAVAAGVASAAVGAGISALTSKGQSGAISSGQQQANADLQPFVNTGTLANAQTANLLGLNGTDAATNALSTFQTSPGYDFTKSEGLKAIDAGAAAKGMLRSGATLKAEDAYGTNLANQEFQQYISNLNGLANMGQSSAAGQANVATGAAGQQASIYGNEGNALAKSVTGLASNPSVQNGLTSLFSGSGAGEGLATSPDLYTGGGTF